MTFCGGVQLVENNQLLHVWATHNATRILILQLFHAKRLETSTDRGLVPLDRGYEILKHGGILRNLFSSVVFGKIVCRKCMQQEISE